MAAVPERRKIVSRWQLWRFLLVIAVDLVGLVGAQSNNPNPTTDPAEARALNAMFARWGISATSAWNTTGDACSGGALGDNPRITDQTMNPGIKCDCSANNSSLCHITALRVFDQDIGGALPDELWSLTHMTDLNLSQNYLSGRIPPSIGNLSRMEYLDLGVNDFSGPVPPQLGLLTNLLSLGIGINNFSGPLPHELGNLSRLQQFFIGSGGVSGPIPETFANLQNMQIFWGYDIDLTGEIPAFIGNWTNLQTLRFQGNSFQGPIPSSFSNLILLNELRISEVQNINSSLDFLANLTSLSNLILRNNNISGSIPIFFNRLQSLSLLDLSFNNLNGRIPDDLFNHVALRSIFLGNNSLSGMLPSSKSDALMSIDVSYNELSGTLPSWTRVRNLQLNLVANNFDIDRSDIRDLPEGLRCLQRNFSCHRGSPKYSNFSIKCGGPEYSSSYSHIVYEGDNETLGPATYYMKSTGRWAVSNVGLPAIYEEDNPVYRASTRTLITNTIDLELFQTARISAGSLRYYGLGLENGLYSLILQFAEIVIVNGRSFRTPGRRLFDIYVQGNLVSRDFDIRRKAGGRSLYALSTIYQAEVVNNYLEVHLFWAGKGTCCVPYFGTYGPLISTIQATPNFVPMIANELPNQEPNRTDHFVATVATRLLNQGPNRTGLIVGAIIGVVVIMLSLATIIFILNQKRKRSLEDEELHGIDVRPYTFSYAELRIATNDFNLANKLGEGGFGSVYMGTLSDGREVAVKQLSVTSHQGKLQFVAEIASISIVQHRNIVKLYGCCIKGPKRFLVYEYLEYKSLDQILFGENSKGLFLDWPTRYDICLGVAKGLAYLHGESQVRVIHRDIKASNILLDSNLHPKISDFGLAKLYDDNKTHISTNRAGGTFGYVAPEYAMRGHLTEMVDVFSYGVVALEIVSGRSNHDKKLEADRVFLLDWAWNLHANKRDIELLDPKLQKYDKEEVRRVINIGLLCTQASPTLRPAMSRVSAMLSGDIEVPPVTSRPGYLSDVPFNEDSTFTYVDTSTSYPFASADTSMMRTD